MSENPFRQSETSPGLVLISPAMEYVRILLGYLTIDDRNTLRLIVEGRAHGSDALEYARTIKTFLTRSQCVSACRDYDHLSLAQGWPAYAHPVHGPVVTWPAPPQRKRAEKP